MIKNIFVWGLNFKKAPLEYREKLACSKDEARHILPILRSVSRLEELVLISTCNRVELYAIGDDYGNVYKLITTLIELKGLNPSIKKYSFFLEGKEAVAHIFRVASSLDSMVVGEPQITSQFKEAFYIAKEVGTVGKILNRIFERALRCSKRVRTETGISKNAVSVSYAAVELIKKIFGNLKGIKVLLIGAGEMAELAASYLKKLQAHIFITNRTYEKAIEIAKKLEGNAIRFENLLDYIHEYDVVLCSTASRQYILTKEAYEKAIKKRKYKPVFIVDISVPRNIDPEINDIENVFLYDVDDLKEVAQKNLMERFKEKEKAEIIIWDEVEKFIRWLEFIGIEKQIIKLRQEWKEEMEKSWKVRYTIHKVIEEIKRNPKSAKGLFKIFLQEVTDGNETRRISNVHNGNNGA